MSKVDSDHFRSDSPRITGPTTRLLLIAAASWLLSMGVLHRWLVTDYGAESFGRVWIFYNTWTDFGFARRALLGTLLTESRANQLLDNEYVFAYAFHTALLTFAYALIVLAFLRRPPAMENGWFQAAVLFSPAFLTHLGYATGTLDLPLIVVLLLVLFFARRLWQMAVLVVVGVLIHELFLFVVPAIVVLMVMEERAVAGARPLRTALWLAGTGALAGVAAGTIGRLQVSQRDYEDIMRERLPNAAGDQPLWSGYWEASSTPVANVVPDSAFESLLGAWPWALVPTIYALVAAGALAWFVRARPATRLLLAAACLLPAAATVVATDYYRWVSVSATVSLLAMLCLYGLGRMRLPTWAAVALLAFALVGPFGAAGNERPFPLQQTIIERLTG